MVCTEDIKLGVYVMQSNENSALFRAGAIGITGRNNNAKKESSNVTIKKWEEGKRKTTWHYLIIFPFDSIIGDFLTCKQKDFLARAEMTLHRGLVAVSTRPDLIDLAVRPLRPSGYFADHAAAVSAKANEVVQEFLKKISRHPIAPIYDKDLCH